MKAIKFKMVDFINGRGRNPSMYTVNSEELNH
jgi:hypothetical protein